MNSAAPPSLAPLLERLRPHLPTEGQAVYVVGGAVRDAVMGRPVHDVDLAVATGAISLAFRLAKALGLPAYALDDERDVGRIVFKEQGITLDIARFRGPTLESDLLGRDFTINAMALPTTGQGIEDVIDLHDGLSDLQAGFVRAVHSSSIDDDPVRALRAARFAAQFGFRLTDETAAAAKSVAPRLRERTSAERMRDELSRILTCGAPYRGIALLAELDLLSVALPHVAALDGVAQSPPHHEDVLRHTLSVLRYLVQIEALLDGAHDDTDWAAAVDETLSPFRARLLAHLDSDVDGGTTGRLLLLWGGLLHDVGKRDTQTIDADGRIRFLGHDEVGATIASRILHELSFSNEAVRRVKTIVAGHMRPLYLATEDHLPSRRTIYRYFRALHEAGLEVGLLALADHLATYDGIGDEQAWSSLLAVINALYSTYFNEHEQTVAPTRLLDGHSIMALLDTPPGHEIGRLLRLLEEAQAAGEISTRDEAVAFVRHHHAL